MGSDTKNHASIVNPFERNGESISTFSGREFWPFSPRPEEIHIEDIAHALAMQCRFGGHCRTFYSVAQHSVLVSQACHSADAFWGLLHDAAEAYLVDVPTPIKRHNAMSLYRQTEKLVQEAICARFSLRRIEPKNVARADKIVFATEARDLLPAAISSVNKLSELKPLNSVIEPWDPVEAEAQFLKRFDELYNQPNLFELLEPVDLWPFPPLAR